MSEIPSRAVQVPVTLTRDVALYIGGTTRVFPKGVNVVSPLLMERLRRTGAIDTRVRKLDEESGRVVSQEVDLPDFPKMTNAQLRAYCEDKGVTLPAGRITKVDLLKAIGDHHAR